MVVKEGFSDFMIVDEAGRIEYVYVPSPDYYDFRPEEVIGTTPQQQYNNLSDEASTLLNAVEHGITTKDHPQELITLEGKRIRQVSDTFCVRNNNSVVGAIEFAYYDKQYADSNKKIKPGKAKVKPVKMEDMVGSSPVMEELRRKFRKVINIGSPILLIGETGTGKEMAARIIHNASKRSKKEFVYVNCGAIPENLLEGILFGIRKGSFTDAEEKEGLFKIADNGTIFLDEINTMPVVTQGKILRAIEEKRIRPVGGETEIPVDVRIIASCNAEIDDILQDQRMRNDLYFRLAVIQFEMPPLRERREDIGELVKVFIKELNERSMGKNIKGIDDKVAAFFQKYRWPGNVRELKNTIEGAYYASDGDILKFDDMEERFSERKKVVNKEESRIAEDFFESDVSLKEYMDRRMKEYIADTLEKHDGVLKDAAKSMGLSIQMLKYNMDKYQMKL